MTTPQDLAAFVHLERDAIRDRVDHESLLTEPALIASGRAIGGLFASSITESVVTFRCEENFAHFRPGERLILTSGTRTESATLLALYDAGRTLELSVSRSTDDLFDVAWTAREEVTDLTISYLTALKKLQPGAPGWSFFRIITGQKSPKPPADSNLDDVELLYDELCTVSGRSLDQSQKDAWLYCLSAQSLAGVQGPPGTGKTLVLAFLVEALVRSGKRVAVLAPTHQATNMALTTIHRLFPTRDIVKVGAAAKIDSLDPDIKVINRENKSSTPAEGRVTGMTYATAIFQLMIRTSTTVPNILVIDEAGQLPLVQGAFSGLSGAGKTVLFGDDKQMPPVFPGNLKNHPLALSIFEQVRKSQPECIVPLRFTYRLNPQLANAIGVTFYPELEEDGLISRQTEPSQYLEANPADGTSLYWYHVPADHTRQLNEAEAVLTVNIVAKFLKEGLPPDQIAVVTPFRRQVARIRTLLAARDLYIEGTPIIDTVERVQGATVEVIIVSLCASAPEYISGIAEFLFSPNRMNVAISRARNKAIVLSAPDVFSHLPDTYNGIVAREMCRNLMEDHAQVIHTMPWQVQPS